MPSNVFSRKFLSVYPSASRLTSVNSAALGAVDLNSGPYTGAIVNINITAYTGATNVVFTVEGKDPESGTYFTLLASAALTATGHTVLRIDPRSVAAANLTASSALPRTFRVITTVTGTATVLTFSVALTLVP